MKIGGNLMFLGPICTSRLDRWNNSSLPMWLWPGASALLYRNYIYLHRLPAAWSHILFLNCPKIQERSERNIDNFARQESKTIVQMLYEVMIGTN